MTDTDRLAELAAAATPGPWTTDYGGQNWWIASCGLGEEGMTVWSPNSPTPDHGGEREDDGGAADRANAALIAACDPATIRDLVAAVRERDELRAALDRIIRLADSIEPTSNLLYPYRQEVVAVARAALAASPAPEPTGLDAERLARALPTVFRAFIPAVTPDPNYDRNVDRQWAEAIAAEYARLTEEAERG